MVFQNGLRISATSGLLRHSRGFAPAEGWGGHDCSRYDFGFISNDAGECVLSACPDVVNYVSPQVLKRINYRLMLCILGR